MAVLRKILAGTVLCALFIIVPMISFAAQAPLVKPLAPITTGISTPVRLAVDGQGAFYLTDPRAGAILKYDISGSLLATIPFAKAQGVAITAAGDLIVSHGNTVSILDQTGTVKKALGKGAGQFKSADGITLDSAGYIYVVDALDNTVQVFNSAGSPVNIAGAANGKPANSFGSEGSAIGQFSMPTGITYEKSSGLIAVVDTLNSRIQFFDKSGIWKKSIGGTGSSVSFTMPVSVDFDYNAANGMLQRMYVTDSFQSGVHVVDPVSTPVSLGYIGGYGKGIGKLMNPYGAVIDKSSGTLMVANGYGNVSLWGIDGGGTPPNMPPPALSIDTFPSMTSSSTVILKGTTDAGVKLSASADTAATVGVPQLVGTSWSLTVSGLTAGINSISVTASDNFGTSTTKTALITYDQAAVAFSLNSVTTPTNLTSQTLTGTREAGATVDVSVTAPLVAGAVNYPSATTWNCTVSSLVVGDNLVNLVASLNGKVPSSASVMITLKAAPHLALFMVSDGAVVSSPLLTVSGETDTDISSVTINGVQSPVSGGIFSRAILLAGGTNSITVSATDSLGSNTSVTRHITFDPLAPVVTISSPAAGSVINSLSSILVQGSFIGSAGSTVKVNGANAAINGSTWSATVVPVAGVYGIDVVIKDGAKQAEAFSFVQIVDLTRPQINVNVPSADLFTAASSTSISGNAKGAAVSATMNGLPLATVFNPVTGNYSATASTSSDGTYLLVFTTTDAYGTASTAFRTIIVKTTPPALTVTAQSSTAVNGTADAGSTIFVRNAAGTIIGQAKADSTGAWNIPLSGAVPPLNIYAIDFAGNNSRSGNISGSGIVDVTDALYALRLSSGIGKPASADLLRGDVAPLINGQSMPDGKIDIDDVMLIMMRAAGLPW